MRTNLSWPIKRLTGVFACVCVCMCACVCVCMQVMDKGKVIKNLLKSLQMRSKLHVIFKKKLPLVKNMPKLFSSLVF